MRIEFPRPAQINALVAETGMEPLQARYHLMGLSRARQMIAQKRYAAARGRPS